ncbi:LysR substrate-binding domain-containing protein [Fulvivirga maritima]|uniref:hydrogen peroxide-inducible genes activator n=1 Tax=Fulvivirga maritima TaxID=2904247 RepID=UPI001F2D4EA5|nr:hydrogen peroxide-inducible genes activator [Fulvivirga maritima]UII25045.1 LysR substrate-binding domain-containing protein [Fulvivirga maritima]
MTLQQLQYIVALDTHRHFVKAADSCFVAQPTLTLQVKKLEEEIGMSIFDRSTQPITPTLMGERFIIKARQILREVAGLKEMVNQELNDVKGSFKIGIIPTVAPYLLPLFLKNFSDDHPDIYLEIKEIQSEEIIAGIQNNTLDIGIMATPLAESHVREIPLFYEPFLVYAHRDHALLKKEAADPTNIERKGLWLLDKGHCFRNQVLNICDEERHNQSDARISFESGSIETLKNMIQSHSGYTLIPELAVHSTHDADFVKRFKEPQPAREVSLVVHNSFTKELLLSKLRKYILKGVPDSFKKNERFITVKWR